MSTHEVISMHVGIVHVSDMICHVCAEFTRSGVYTGLAKYVRESAPLQLWPEDRNRVMDLLSEGCFKEAVELYFDADPQRWTPEILTIETHAVTVPAGDASFEIFTDEMRNHLERTNISDLARGDCPWI